MQTVGKAKEDIPGLKNRIAELERQSNEFRTKVEELRRAKAATTVVKTEKEYVNAGASGTSRTEKVKCDRCEELEGILHFEKKSNVQLKKQIEQKDTARKQPLPASTTSAPCPKCPTSQEMLDRQKEENIEMMDRVMTQEKKTQEARAAKESVDRYLSLAQSQLVDAKHRREKLQKENQDYRDACEKMTKEYADKMAELCRQEEEAKKQIATWEQMYSEWMSTMEKRVNNLQITDQEFNASMHNDNSHRRSGGAGNQRR
ncbi:unnamed protein product [Adineta ricciae]|uniref:Uncharacterized protein n=1 Tax=Adineta ricciae TaxID=249248 RepID=A0A814KMY5_ADIRI|nr:unnamed protein product [Adineta ricciae]CAF1115977.1 unnamed protein product [Adineta ricciae]